MIDLFRYRAHGWSVVDHQQNFLPLLPDLVVRLHQVASAIFASHLVVVVVVVVGLMVVVIVTISW